MNERTYRLLEYHKIQELLAGQTQSELGRALAEKWFPAADLKTVSIWQRETAEAKEIIGGGERLPLGNIFPLETGLTRVELGGVMNGEELYQTAMTCQTADIVKHYLDEHETHKALRELSHNLSYYARLVKTLLKAIGEEGQVLDSASDALSALRKQYRTVENRIRDKLEQMTRSSEWQKYLQEGIFTMRGDRFVIPVKQEYRQMVQGVVHDVSGSGATLFVEPLPVVEMSNQLKQLAAAMEEEIARILRELSVLVREEAAGIKASLAVLVRMDLIFARGRLAMQQRAVEPLLNDRGFLDLKQARHPLLTGKVVPIDISLGSEFNILVITGPNTGGKTVTLKTVGLLTLMAQAGLQIPAGSASEIALFKGVYCDLGDEQSIEQNLSTFSGHIKNIVEILKNAIDRESLVLLDELGAGTDPQEGAALAMSLLEHLQSGEIRAVATTHYSEIKSFVYKRPGYANASMEFDMETLSPTFHLMIGLPGHSNALAIASRLGVPGEIITSAQSFLTHDVLKVEDILSDLATEQKKSRENRQKTEALTLDAEKLKSRYEQEWQRLNQEKEAILQKTRENARQILQSAREEAEEIVREIREAGDTDVAQATYKMREAFREKMAGIEQGQDEEKATGHEQMSHADIKTGTKVQSLRLGQTGQILEVYPDKKEVLVRIGVVRTILPFEDLGKVNEAKVKPRVKHGTGLINQEKGETISAELHLRGMTVEEAITVTDKYLDDACVAGLSRVRIIHGKGTGVLRKEITAYLKKHPRVKRVYLADISEGGMGATIAELD